MTREEFLILEQKCNAIRQRATEAGKRAQLDPPPSEPLTSVKRAGTASESEAALHDEIIKFCRKAGYLYFHGAMGTRTSRTEGEPDFTICLPEGHTLFVECKTKTGKLSPAQQAVHHQASTLGHTFHVVRCIGDFMQLITDTYDATQSLPKTYAPFAALRNPIGGVIPQPHWNGQQYPTGTALWAAHNRFKGLTATEISEVLRKRNADSMLDDVCADPAELMQQIDAIQSAVLKGEMKTIGDIPTP